MRAPTIVPAAGLAVIIASLGADAAETIPPSASIRPDRPRLLLRPSDTPLAVSLGKLRALPLEGESAEVLRRLEGLRPPRAAALALVHLVTGRPEPAAKALEVLRSWRRPVEGGSRDDPFDVWFTLADLALAYDWLHDAPALDAAARAAIRDEVVPFAENALRLGEDHVFHNYIWMWPSRSFFGHQTGV